MKLFKKAVLATAIVGAFGVNAATVSSDPVKLSAEGVANKLEASNVAFEVDFVVGKETPAASTITLTFDKTVDLSDLKTAAGTGSENVVNDPSKGTGLVTSDGTAGGTTLITFNYGTGSFTFDKFKVDTDANTLSFDVNLGNPVTANSAFRMSFATAAGVDFTGKANVAYKSETSSDVLIEDGSGALATTQNQFSFSVKTSFDGLIERLEKTTFSKNAADTAKETDDLKFALTDNADNLQASLTATTTAVEFAGAFDNGNKTAADNVESADFAVSGTGNTAAISKDSGGTIDAVDVTIADNQVTTDGKDSVFTLTFDGNKAIVIPQTGDIKAKATVTVSDANVDPIVVAEDVDAGKWALDATIINIPYFPVGYNGLSTSVHFANESANAADVIVEAIDDEGNEYNGTLTDLAGNTVTKVGQDDVMKALGLDMAKNYKLSVTFNIDANTGDVNAYAFSNAGDARQSLVTSQEKGSDK